MKNKTMLGSISKRCLIAIMSATMMMSSVGATLAFPMSAYAVDYSVTSDITPDEAGNRNLTSGDTLANNNGDINVNNGIITENNGSVTTNNGTVTTNNATVTTNNGTVTTNNGTVTFNIYTGTVTTNSGTVYRNTGEISTNSISGTVTTNTATGTVTTNNGTVTDIGIGGTVTTNNGTVTGIRIGGTVTTNNDTIGTNNGTVNTNSGTITDNSDGIVNTNSAGGTVTRGTVVTNNGTAVNATVTYNHGTANNSQVTNNYEDGRVTGTDGNVVNNYWGYVDPEIPVVCQFVHPEDSNPTNSGETSEYVAPAAPAATNSMTKEELAAAFLNLSSYADAATPTDLSATEQKVYKEFYRKTLQNLLNNYKSGTLEELQKAAQALCEQYIKVYSVARNTYSSKAAKAYAEAYLNAANIYTTDFCKKYIADTYNDNRLYDEYAKAFVNRAISVDKDLSEDAQNEIYNKVYAAISSNPDKYKEYIDSLSSEYANEKILEAAKTAADKASKNTLPASNANTADNIFSRVADKLEFNNVSDIITEAKKAVEKPAEKTEDDFGTGSITIPSFEVPSFAIPGDAAGTMGANNAANTGVTTINAEKDQLAAVKTAIASVPTILASNNDIYSSTGMPLNMTSVSTLDASTATLLAANNKIPYNVTITFNGAPMTVKIPAGFNYKSYIKADGSINIHEVIWAVLSN